MAQASNVLFRIEASSVPLLEGAIECVKDKQIPGGLDRNREYLLASDEGGTRRVQIEKSVRADLTTLLFDPQTSGGLLAAVPSDRVVEVRAALEDQDVHSWEIGEVQAGQGVLVA
jgi:selenide, water dikinase